MIGIKKLILTTALIFLLGQAPAISIDPYIPQLEPLGSYYITGYDYDCSHCCGKSNGITASGIKATPNRTIAMYGVPFGTRVYIAGLGVYVVEDRGVGSGVVDVACETHKECYALTGRREVYIIKYGM